MEKTETKAKTRTVPVNRSLMERVKDSLIHRLLDFTGSQRFLTTQLDITNACNLTCVHCYHDNHSNRGALDFAGWRRILDQYEALTKKLYLRPRFILCGGEPTLSPMFRPMLHELSGRWPEARITILTNGLPLSPELTRFLAGFDVAFQISLDGPDARRNDLIRGPGAFDGALAGLKNLQAAGLNASFLATLSRRNSSWLADFYATAARAKIESMNFTRFITEGDGRRLEESGVDRPLAGPELRGAYEAILSLSRKTGVPTNTNLPLFHLIDPSLGAHGKVGFQGLVIDYMGNLKVSSRVGYKLGNVLEEGLEALFLEHPLMRDLRDRKIEGCGPCVHYERCGGDRNASFAATGSFLKKDPSCWFEVAN